MDFSRFNKKTKGPNKNNGEVQCLLRYQEGQVKKRAVQKIYKTKFPCFLKIPRSSNLNSWMVLCFLCITNTLNVNNE